MSETTLTYQVFVAPIIAIAGKDVPPGQSRSTGARYRPPSSPVGMTPSWLTLS
jgi:hypothetical protein